MHPLVYNSLLLFGYGIAGVIMMSVALGILIKVWDWITPINEWEELKKGNLAVAIVVASVIIAFAMVVSAAINPGL
jgi:uncharacterized membrane protein YjfL (UPF0719 family)